jgi:probable rRNA maturation factor
VIDIHVSNRQSALRVDPTPIVAAVREVLADHQVVEGDISVAIVDDATIRELNRRHLDHDYATDVLSFLLDRTGERLEGEVIVSADRARAVSPRYGWADTRELLLYVIHGTLHLVGYRDETSADRQEMRRQERHYLRALKDRR